mmetsp:Transcript_21979/g.52798  ORF Transcript_21979/g.52798 Transcript_21979/m.52798 type:complete len:379 (+) Transcript_21979:789-1925(+)
MRVRGVGAGLVGARHLGLRVAVRVRGVGAGLLDTRHLSLRVAVPVGLVLALGFGALLHFRDRPVAVPVGLVLALSVHALLGSESLLLRCGARPGRRRHHRRGRRAEVVLVVPLRHPRLPLRSEDNVGADLPEGACGHLGAGVEGLDDGLQTRHRRGIHHIRLVEEDVVSDFNLFREQLHHPAVRVRLQAVLLDKVGAHFEGGAGLVHVEEVARVDHRHHVLEGCVVESGVLLRSHHEERLPHVLGLGHPGRLDDDAIVHLALFGRDDQQLQQRLQQFVGRRAAGAAVLELHHVRGVDQLSSDLHRLLLLAVGDDKLRVDVDRRDVVDDHADLEPALVLQHLPQERGLARSKEAREERDWDLWALGNRNTLAFHVDHSL